MKNRKIKNSTAQIRFTKQRHPLGKRMHCFLQRVPIRFRNLWIKEVSMNNF
jgi:hypothetical protein